MLTAIVKIIQLPIPTNSGKTITIMLLFVPASYIKGIPRIYITEVGMGSFHHPSAILAEAFGVPYVNVMTNNYHFIISPKKLSEKVILQTSVLLKHWPYFNASQVHKVVKEINAQVHTFKKFGTWLTSI